MPRPKKSCPQMLAPVQRIVVFQQNGSGEQKIEGIRRYGRGRFDLRCIHIDQDLPPFIDNAADYLPPDIDADLVLDFLKHPDLSHDLAVICGRRGIPVVASGKKIKVEGILTPPT